MDVCNGHTTAALSPVCVTRLTACSGADVLASVGGRARHLPIVVRPPAADGAVGHNTTAVVITAAHTLPVQATCGKQQDQDSKTRVYTMLEMVVGYGWQILAQQRPVYVCVASTTGRAVHAACHSARKGMSVYVSTCLAVIRTLPLPPCPPTDPIPHPRHSRARAGGSVSPASSYPQQKMLPSVNTAQPKSMPEEKEVM
jgi:hypothetical protein